jgi:hypothetical protein
LVASHQPKIPAQDQTGATTIHHQIKENKKTKNNNKRKGKHGHSSNKVKTVSWNGFATNCTGTKSNFRVVWHSYVYPNYWVLGWKKIEHGT